MASEPDNAVANEQENAPVKSPSKKNEEDLYDEDLVCMQENCTSASSTTSNPKPFLHAHYQAMVVCLEQRADSEQKKILADFLSFLAMTMSTKGSRDSLRFRLLDSGGDIASWGCEYVRNLTGEIIEEYGKQQSPELGCVSIDSFEEIVDQVVSFHMEHKAESVAVDLLLEVGDIDRLERHVSNANYKKVCMYLTTVAGFHAQNDPTILEVAYRIYYTFKDYAKALQVALFTGYDFHQHIEDIFKACEDLPQKKQLCYILSRHDTPIELHEEMVAEDEDRGTLQGIINNSKLSEAYLTLAHALNVMEPISPEDIYKARVLYKRASAGASVDSASEDVAAMFVNAFVNAGFCEDTLITVPSEASGDASSGDWVFKNKEFGKFSAAASLGLIHLWDVFSVRTKLYEYICSNDNYAIAGGLLGVGIANCSIRHNLDQDLSPFLVFKDDEDTCIRIGAIMGLGLAYAGTRNNIVKSHLTTILLDPNVPLDVLGFTAISLGLVNVGWFDSNVRDAMIHALTHRSESEFGKSLLRLLPLGIGILYIGVQGYGEFDTNVLPQTIRKYAEVTMLSCAYAGTGDVYTVEQLLGQCKEHLGREATHQGAAVLGLAMVAMFEEVGIEMVFQSMEHLLQYGERNIRRAVPLALALLYISNPKVEVVRMLTQLFHDTDTEVVKAAILSIGLVGAGTNNSRIAGMLGHLSSLYIGEPSVLFLVRIAQSLLHLGKGLLTLDPYHSERFLLRPTALAGLITVMHSCLDMRFLRKYHFVLYFLVLAMQPRMLMTVDEDLRPLSVPVWVGQAIADVGQAIADVGLVRQPKVVRGLKTQSTPVLLAAGERAKVETKKYIPLSTILEGVVVLKKNPEYKDDS